MQKATAVELWLWMKSGNWLKKQVPRLLKYWNRNSKAGLNRDSLVKLLNLFQTVLKYYEFEAHKNPSFSFNNLFKYPLKIF